MMCIPVIICGGAGSRLWPVSREAFPKPFIRLNDGQSLLQKTFLRAMSLPQVGHILTVTSGTFVHKTEDEMSALNSKNIPLSYICEPVGRQTAAAIAAAALAVAESSPNVPLIVMPADHLITNDNAFYAAVNEALALALKGKLVTFGIRPTAPETGYGYIEYRDGAVQSFVEKPDKETARGYVESGCFFWNSGMFCFQASTVLGEMEKYCPDILQAVRKSSVSKASWAIAQGSRMSLDTTHFAAVRADSFDCSVMEKSDCVAMVPGEMGWIDVGSWSSIGSLIEADSLGNRIEGKVVLHDVKDCHIQSSDRVVAAVGVRDLIVIDTPDAILVADNKRTEEVKHIVAALKKDGHQSYLVHRTVHRPWGTYTVLEEGEGFKIKRIVVKPGAILSLQLHNHRSEHWVVVSGMAEVTIGDTEQYVSVNESVFVPVGVKHRLANSATDDLILIEVQSGAYLGEDDIVRFEDKYGRAQWSGSVARIA